MSSEVTLKEILIRYFIYLIPFLSKSVSKRFYAFLRILEDNGTGSRTISVVSLGSIYESKTCTPMPDVEEVQNKVSSPDT